MNWAALGFTSIGIVCLGYYCWAWVEAGLYERQETRAFEARIRWGAPYGKGSIPPPAALVPEDGGLLGKLEIPRLRLSVMVVEGVDSGDLRKAVGHIPGTSLPGEAGNVGIAGHRDTYFRPLSSIHPGDKITLTSMQGRFTYRVVSTEIVGPDDVQVLNPTGRNTLTLVTCFPFYYVGPAPKRFIVRAAAG